MPTLLMPLALIVLSACTSELSDVARDEYSIAEPNAVCRQADLARASDTDEAKLGNAHDAFVITYVSCVNWSQSHSIDEPYRLPHMSCPQYGRDTSSAGARGPRCSSAR